MHIDPSHPRYQSLKAREKLVWGVKKGLTTQAGLIAHGRGEAFDYLIKERTHFFAKEAIEATAAYLLLAEKPILSLNGNTAILVGREMCVLADELNCFVEINLFHFTSKRAELIEQYMEKFSKKRILKTDSKKVIIPSIASSRKITLRDGIAASDCVFIPLEDGDRAQALIAKEKKVLAIDLNPLSRTARFATVTIVDNILRTFPLLIKKIKKYKKLSKDDLIKITKVYNNNKVLQKAVEYISTHYEK